MDGYNALSNASEYSTLQVYTSPDIYTINTTITPRQPQLEIKGQNIPVALKGQISVTIGDVTCPVVNVTASMVICDGSDAIRRYLDDSPTLTKTPSSRRNFTTSSSTTVSATTIVIQESTLSTSQTVLPDPTVSTSQTVIPDPTVSTSQTFIPDPTAPPSPTEDGSTSVLCSNNTVERNCSLELATGLDRKPAAMIAELVNVEARNVSVVTVHSPPRRHSYSLMIKIGNFEKTLVNIVTIKDDESLPLQGSFWTERRVITIATVGCVLVIMALAIICGVKVYIRRQKRKIESSVLGSLKGSAESYVPSLRNVLADVLNAHPDSEDLDSLIIPLDRLHLGKTLGSGNFGLVYEGRLSFADKPAEKVAVKTLQDPSSHTLDLRGFVQEAVIMKDFRHPHVLGLVGLAERSTGVPYVILPYMDNGDLHSYVKDDKVTLTHHDVIRYGADIACGMQYLSDKKLVHRDLAARNCMLDNGLRAKVADFGLSRDIYEKSYYSSDNKKKLPVRWMAPESIENGNYSTKSDVWSMGVVLWELLTRGVTPYPGVDGWDITNFLRRRRLAPPFFCHDRMFSLMMQCWAAKPNTRPTFAKIRVELLIMIGEDPFSTTTEMYPETFESPPLSPTGSQCNADKDNYLIIGKNSSKRKGKPTPKPRKSLEESAETQMRIKKEHEANLQRQSTKKSKHFSHVMSIPKRNVIDDVTITIPACFGQKEVHPTAASEYLQLVDNYETAPKFKNSVFKVKKSSSKTSKSRKSGKGSKKDNTHKPSMSTVYSEPFIPGAEVGDIHLVQLSPKNPAAETLRFRGQENEKGYYDIEGFDPYQANASSTINRRASNITTTSSEGSILDSRFSVESCSSVEISSVGSSPRSRSQSRAKSSYYGGQMPVSPLVSVKHGEQSVKGDSLVCGSGEVDGREFDQDNLVEVSFL